MLLIGTDEAGYGPNLGPLVVAATAWQVPDSTTPPDLYASLSDSLTSSSSGRASRNAAYVDARLAVADSKTLYSPAAGLAALELGTLAMATTLGLSAPDWRSLWPAFAPASAPLVLTAPWFADYNAATPCTAGADAVAAWSARLQTSFDQADCRLVAMRASVIAPEEFNERIATAGGKGVVLSETTLALVRDLLADGPPQPAFVFCDKHGGRNRYGELLQRGWPDDLVQVLEESRESSRYRWGAKTTRVEIEFRVGGEAQVPCAAASMLAKYLRERSMEAFNAFWQSRVPQLTPTAGYPVDAARFRRDIAAALKELAVPDRVLWRNK